MAAKWIEKVTGTLEQKRQYKAHRARIGGLPEPYATAAGGSTATSCTTEASRRARRS